MSFKLYLATSETISYRKYDMFNEKGKLRTADLAKILKEDGDFKNLKMCKELNSHYFYSEEQGIYESLSINAVRKKIYVALDKNGLHSIC